MIIVELPPASPPEPVAPPPPIEVAPQEPYRPPPQVLPAFRIEGGATFTRIYDIPINGGQGSLAVGAEFPGPFAIYGNLTLFGGQQETGLSAVHVKLGGEVEGRFGRLRLGAGVNVGYLSLGQATTNSDIAALTFGVEGRVSFDVLRWGEREKGALFVVGKIGGDAIGGWDASPWIWGPTVGLGARF
jgi:hypothetical protein